MVLATRAVLDKTVKDFKLLCFWIYFVVQVIFLSLYGYKIATNIDRVTYLIIYISLAVLSLVTFIIFLCIGKIKKKTTKKIVNIAKRIIRFGKYVINASMLVVVCIEIHQYGTNDFNKIITIVSAISLAIQIIVEILRIIYEKYLELFVVAFEMDTRKLRDLKESIDSFSIRGTVLQAVDAIPQRIANAKTGNNNQAQVVELSKTEKKILELKENHKAEIEEKKIEKKEEKQRKKKDKRSKEAKELKEHFSTIFSRKKK